MPESETPPQAFEASSRTRIVFGEGSLSRLGELARECGGARALVVTDRGIVSAGHAGRAVDILRAAGVEAVVFDGARENPTTLDVDRCLAVARESGAEVLIGLGGGSSMDTAKGANFLLTNGGRMQDYWGVGKATKPMLPLIAVPTTSGTGSECQSAALIADEETHQKMACLDVKAAARVALLDPLLTVSQPRRVTAFTGVDALAHALETAVTRRRHGYSMMHSREAFGLLAPSLPVVLERPDDLGARARMQLGAAHAGTAIEMSMLGAVHAAANPLTARFGVVHGAAVGLMLPAVIRFNAADPSIAPIYAAYAVAGGFGGAHLPVALAVERLLEGVAALLDAAGVPATMTEAGADPGRIPELAVEAAKQWTGGFNPRPVDAAAFEVLYRNAEAGRGITRGSSSRSRG